MKYIPLDALVAEIDKMMAEEMKFYETACKEGDEEVSSSPMVYTRLQMLRSSINSLEEKEVDLEREIQDHIKECLDVKFPTTDIELIKKDVAYTAKKFFELGLKAQKGE